MRTIKMTHQEIDMIKTALQYVYDKKIDMINQNRRIMSDDAIDALRKKANEYFDAQSIFDGLRDV